MIDIGTLVNFHGVRGEVKVLSSSDFAFERFSKGQTVTIKNETYTICLLYTSDAADDIALV